MEILFEGKLDKASIVENGSSMVIEDDPRLSSNILAILTNSRHDFVSLYKKVSLFQSSIPRFPTIPPASLFKADIPDPSKRYISIRDIGKNMDDAFLGYSMANPKVSCVSSDKIIFREDYPNMTDRVRIISSGVGLWGDFVGKGMLTCMVLGTHTAPKPRVLYTAIRQLNQTADRGILVIIPNNFEDKVNWGLAIARAYRKGISLKCVTFGDNAYHGYKENERSCLSGIVICYKLAGAMSEERYTLPNIVDRLNMMYFSTISCHIGETVCIGTDLKGRGGFEMEQPTKDKIMKEVFSSLIDPRRKYSIGHDPGAEFVVLINSYRADWGLTQAVSGDVITRLRSHGYVCCRVYAGNLVPSVGAGFSVTIFPDGCSEVIRWLDRYTSCSGWLIYGTGEIGQYRLSVARPEPETKGMWFNEQQSQMVEKAAELAFINFKNSKIYLNSNDPDGGYGTLMCKICHDILENMKLNHLYIQNPYMLFVKIGEIFEQNFKNIDGLMFAMFFITLGQYFGDHKRLPKNINEKTWERALKRSVKSVAGYFKIGYRNNTLLDIFGTLYLIMSSSRLDSLTDIHLALEVCDEYCWKVKYAKPIKIIDYPYLTMKSAYIMLDAVATMLRGSDLNVNRLAPQDIDTTPTVTATKIKELLTAV